MAVRALLHLPEGVRRGDVVELRATVAHPMETGHRSDAGGRLLPRDIIRRVECRYGGELVFAADLFPAVAANPYFAFHVRAEASGPVSVRWTGDNGFDHTVTGTLNVA